MTTNPLVQDPDEPSRSQVLRSRYYQEAKDLEAHAHSGHLHATERTAIYVKATFYATLANIPDVGVLEAIAAREQDQDAEPAPAPEHAEERSFLDKVNDLSEDYVRQATHHKDPRVSPILGTDGQLLDIVNDADNLARSAWETLMYAASGYTAKVPPAQWLSLPQEQRTAWDSVVLAVEAILVNQGWERPDNTTDWTHSTDNVVR